jgi:HPt (histidine-containing phosphotransfer) domain-containing protein
LSEAADKTAKLLAALWVKNRPLVEERLTTLEQAAAGASAGSLPEPLRLAAEASAHKLAGSLGMYGYDEGTRIARQLEALLGGQTPDVAALGNGVAALRRAIFPQG